MRTTIRYAFAGLAAGAVTGILGSGGGLVLVPLLTLLSSEDSESVFPYSLGIMFPICLCSLLVQRGLSYVPFREALPYLLGSILGGFVSMAASKRISPVWLHRVFGCILLWSGFRCLFL